PPADRGGYDHGNHVPNVPRRVLLPAVRVPAARAVGGPMSGVRAGFRFGESADVPSAAARSAEPVVADPRGSAADLRRRRGVRGWRMAIPRLAGGAAGAGADSERGRRGDGDTDRAGVAATAAGPPVRPVVRAGDDR